MTDTIKVVINNVEVTLTPKSDYVVYESIMDSEHFKAVTSLFDLEIKNVEIPNN